MLNPQHLPDPYPLPADSYLVYQTVLRLSIKEDDKAFLITFLRTLVDLSFGLGFYVHLNSSKKDGSWVWNGDIPSGLGGITKTLVRPLHLMQLTREGDYLTMRITLSGHVRISQFLPTIRPFGEIGGEIELSQIGQSCKPVEFERQETLANVGDRLQTK